MLFLRQRLWFISRQRMSGIRRQRGSMLGHIIYAYWNSRLTYSCLRPRPMPQALAAIRRSSAQFRPRKYFGYCSPTPWHVSVKLLRIFSPTRKYARTMTDLVRTLRSRITRPQQGKLLLQCLQWTPCVPASASIAPLELTKIPRIVRWIRF